MKKSEVIYEYVLKKLEKEGTLKQDQSSVFWCGTCAEGLKEEICEGIDNILEHGK